MGKKENTTNKALLAGEKQKKKKQLKCFNCNKCRHKKADCWAKGGGKEGQGPKGKGGKQANSGNAVKDSNNDLEAFSAEVIDEDNSDLCEDELQAAVAENEDQGMT